MKGLGGVIADLGCLLGNGPRGEVLELQLFFSNDLAGLINHQGQLVSVSN